MLAWVCRPNTVMRAGADGTVGQAVFVDVSLNEESLAPKGFDAACRMNPSAHAALLLLARHDRCL